MIRYFLARGDRGGSATITEGLEHVTCSNPPPPVQIATLYMRTYCTACKQDGFIAPKGPRLPGTGPNGKPWALSGDINVCRMQSATHFPCRARHENDRHVAGSRDAGGRKQRLGRKHHGDRGRDGRADG